MQANSCTPVRLEVSPAGIHSRQVERTCNVLNMSSFIAKKLFRYFTFPTLGYSIELADGPVIHGLANCLKRLPKASFTTPSSGEPRTPPCPLLTSRSRTPRAASAMAPSAPSLTACPLRTCSFHARKGKERPFRGQFKGRSLKKGARTSCFRNDTTGERTL
jgi:hypothetical protein